MGAACRTKPELFFQWTKPTSLVGWEHPGTQISCLLYNITHLLSVGYSLLASNPEASANWESSCSPENCWNQQWSIITMSERPLSQRNVLNPVCSGSGLTVWSHSARHAKKGEKWCTDLAIDDPGWESLNVGSLTCLGNLYSFSISFWKALNILHILHGLLPKHLQTWSKHCFIIEFLHTHQSAQASYITYSWKESCRRKLAAAQIIQVLKLPDMATWSIEYYKGIGWIFDLFLFKTMRAPECTIHLSPNRPQMLCKRELLWTGAGWNFWLQWWQIYVSSGGDNTMNNGHPLEKVGKWLSHIWLTK